MRKNVFVIADTHLPFVHRNYLEFCVKTKRKYNCDRVVHIGDVCDMHSCSYHEHSPDGFSPKDEMDKCDAMLKQWFKAFPKVFVTRGNHDNLVSRKGKTAGLPSRCFKSFREMWKYPKGWVDGFDIIIDGVLYQHGTGFSGKQPALSCAVAHRMSAVTGHTHSVSGVNWTASSRDIIFGMGVGCGLNRKSWAFNYGKDMPRKPILGAGVVYDNKNAQFIPMEM